MLSIVLRILWKSTAADLFYVGNGYLARAFSVLNVCIIYRYIHNLPFQSCFTSFEASAADDLVKGEISLLSSIF